jgi:hypothetical protein
MSSLKFVTLSVRPESWEPATPPGATDPYNQFPHPVETVKKAGGIAQRLGRSTRPSPGAPAREG